MPTDRSRVSLASCDTTGRRGGFPTLLLAIATVWLAAMAVQMAREADMRHVALPFATVALLMAIAMYGSWAATVTWDQIGRFAIWFAFGVTIALWLIGVFSIGWLFVPALVLQLVAIIAWPRDEDHPIVDRTAIGAEILGFLSSPLVLGVGHVFASPLA